MDGTPQQSGDKVHVATLPTSAGEHHIYMPSKGIEELFSDGVAGLLVNGAVAKLDFYSTEVDYASPNSGAVTSENRVLTQRLVIPVSSLLDLFLGFIDSINFEAIDNKHDSLRGKLALISEAAAKKAKINV